MYISWRRYLSILFCFFLFLLSLNSLIFSPWYQQHSPKEILTTIAPVPLFNTRTIRYPPQQPFWFASVSPKQRAQLPKRVSSSIFNSTLSILANSSVVVIACCRHAHNFLPTFRRNLQSIVSVFGNYTILFGESDSSDLTLPYFKNWSALDPRVHVQSYDKLDVMFTRRTVRIAFCRNSLLNVARLNRYIQAARFLIVLDVDVNSNEVLTKKTFLTNFEYPLDSWGAMTASQANRYYDIWALRHNPGITYDCWEMIHNDTKNGGNFGDAFNYFVMTHQKPIPKDHEIIEVESAFGGFSIYQTKYIRDCMYVGFGADGRELCEHVPFNMCVRSNGGRIFINPSFQNSKGDYH